MKNSEILARLDLGQSVAENDRNLASYFVPTVAVSDFVTDRYDLIRGVKGSGKSALLRVVSGGQANYPELKDVLLHVATEHAGEPSFKRAFDQIKKDSFSEAELVAAWKTYLLNLVLDALSSSSSAEAKAALAYAEKVGIRFRTTSNYKKIFWSLLRFLHVEKFSVSAEGLMAEFPDAPPAIWTDKPHAVVDFPEALRLCSDALKAQSQRCWVLVDRLDAAFQDEPALEQAALKSLLVAYKDFMGYDTVRLKLFLRTDLFDQVTRTGGFRELTHVLDRTSPPMAWDSDQLLAMIMERFMFNESIQKKYGLVQVDMRDPDLRQAGFFSIFSGQIEVGSRQSDSWTWIFNRIRDGNGIRTPRDLHALVTNAARKESDILSRGGDEASDSLISPAAVKAGLDQMSQDKVRTSLIAENPGLESSIRAFQRGKAEHNGETLKKLLGPEWDKIVEDLQRIGFVERVGDSWKIPQLYRSGLEITQGAAFEK
ncbi:P-loop ATPase, Sll1717 family [Variovorax paradoxus]|uniref:ATPase n=1 Tax=Variovorax paradoxus (strain EPS) TaxID=595537 RepID=E6V9T1_VARPE|nr:hypothetical protein [Variovorax paradoxus]ADU36219.1 hypothetical protein Varpa_2011 [Variovorax paradoxus EPS]